MIKHPFINQFFPESDKILIKPEENKVPISFILVKKDLTPLFDEILNFVPVAKDYSDNPFRMQIANL